MPSSIAFASRKLADLTIPFEVNVDARTGAAIATAGVPLTRGRSSFQPALSLTYTSSGRNSILGVGWALGGVPSVAIASNDGLPRYDGTDTYTFAGKDLVPWDADGRPRVLDRDDHWIHVYRTQVDTSYSRFEKWVHKRTLRVHWRTRDRTNTVSVFGRDEAGTTRIEDDLNGSRRTFEWLLERQHDRHGNAIEYEYAAEDGANVSAGESFEWDRARRERFPQRYLRRIRYGNTVPLHADMEERAANEWCFSVVLDYGERTGTDPLPYEAERAWPARRDPFSSYRAGFEVRTYRLCRQFLQFHHFPRELGEPATLIGALALEHDEHAAGSTLRRLRYTGYRRDQAARQLPALEFRYTDTAVARSFSAAPETAHENVPAGLASARHKLIDLFGDGLPGILYEGDRAWFYKDNLGGGRFGPQHTVLQKPSMPSGTYAFSDFDGDGNTDLVVLQGREAGHFALDRDSRTWAGFRPFAAAPQVRAFDRHTQLLDLDGDGRADIVTVEPERVVWYRSSGTDGFEAPVELSRPRTARDAPSIGSDPRLDYFFADMTGDGLLDQVRVANGCVEYWPQLGNGRFGERVIMADAPVLEFDGALDWGRVRLVDLDGSGTADLLYIGRGEIRYWINASGNRFIEGGRIGGLPYIDDLDGVSVADFLGDGTLCLVWSTAQGTPTSAALWYLPLTGGIKPRLLESVTNSIGRETRVVYGHSARHYLRDVQSGRGWRTRLPTHTTVVDRLETIEHIGRTRFDSHYAYHDGYFDGDERAFRGFGLVDRYDAEASGGVDRTATEHTDPICVRTWFHNGAFDRARRVEGAYIGDPGAAALDSDVIENVDSFDAKDFAAAFRTLAGQILRTETFGVDRDGRRRAHPYEVSQRSYLVRRLSRRFGNHEASFSVFPSEVLTYTYEQDPADPRITHAVTIAADDFGNITSDCAVAYPRRAVRRIGIDAQSRSVAAVTNNAYFNADERDRYELGTALETRTYQIGGLTAPAVGRADAVLRPGPLARMLEALLAPEAVLPFDRPLTTGAQARLTHWERFLYWNAARTDALPVGNVGELPLLHHREAARFTEPLLGEVFGGRVTSDMVREHGAFRLQDAHWWQSGPTQHYLAAARFNLIEREVRTERREGRDVQAVTSHAYDEPYLLAATGVTDAAGNRTAAAIDYHVLAPARIVDPNENVSEVRYDPLGVVVLAAQHGRLLSGDRRDEPYGDEPLEAYVPRPAASIEEVLANPARFLQQAGTYFHYELDTWTREDPRPLRSLSLARETHVHDGEGGTASGGPIRIQVGYADGFGRSLQIKERVGPGFLDYSRDAAGRVVVDPPVRVAVEERWRAAGHTVFNNKQQVVRQYEPFFTATYAFESDAELNAFGETTVTTYDALGRTVEVLYPNLTAERTEISAWTIRRHDPNDTVAGSRYEAIREALGDDHPEKRALRKAQAHAGTPTEVHLDPLGRAVVLVENGGAGDGIRRTETVLDYAGSPVAVTDARGLPAFAYRRDMSGRVLHERGIDSGDRWTLTDALGRAIHTWDGAGVHQRIEYDLLGRTASVTVESPRGLAKVTERLVYGDDPAVPQAALRNLRGRLLRRYDQAGVVHFNKYDAAGHVLSAARQLTADYKSEPDWRDPSVVVLEAGAPFERRMRYDALGRLVQQELPDGTTRRFEHLRGGGVGAVRVTTADGVLRDAPFLAAAVYNARGQQTEAVLGDADRASAVVAGYEYDRYTRRLARSTARQRTAAGDGRVYQDLRYTYDPVGNIVEAVDLAQQPPDGSLAAAIPLSVDSTTRFVYDAFYQLREAAGRVHRALQMYDYAPDREGLGSFRGTRHITFENMQEIRRYRRTYSYDAAGNLQAIAHTTIGLAGPADEPNQQWTQEFWISGRSNRSLPATDLNDLPISDPESRFDPNGNCLYLPHLQGFEWNHRNNLARAVLVRRAADGGPDDAEYYVYDGDGMRVRKVLERVVDGGAVEIVEKICLDGCEIKRIRGAGGPILERITSHITDGSARLALMHRWTADERALETTNLDEKRIHYQLSNQIGSVSLEINERGDVITYEEYFPYGGSAFTAGHLREAGLKEYRYSAKQRDDATGLYYYGYRYYAPWLGRWLSPDPLGPADGPNLYLFARNNPVNARDALGLQVDPDAQLRALFREYHLSSSGHYGVTGGGIVEEFTGFRHDVRGVGRGNVVRQDVTVRVHRSESGEVVGVEGVITESSTDLTAVRTIEGTIEILEPEQTSTRPASSPPRREGPRAPRRRRSREPAASGAEPAAARAEPEAPEEAPPPQTAQGAERSEPEEDTPQEQPPEEPEQPNESVANVVGFEDPESGMTRYGVEDAAAERSYVPPLPEPSDQEAAGSPASEMYRPYGDNLHLNYVAGVGDSFIDMLGARNMLDIYINAYVRNGEGIEGIVAAREAVDSYLYEEYLREPYEQGGGGMEGVRRVADRALTAVNPLIPLDRAARRAYREHHGGLEGTLAAIDAVNPFAWIRESIAATGDAIERGDAHAAGYHFNSAEVQIAGVVEGFRAGLPARGRLSRRAARQAAAETVEAVQHGRRPLPAQLNEIATQLKREIHAEAAGGELWGYCGASGRLIETMQQVLGESTSVRAVQIVTEEGAGSHVIAVGRTSNGQYFIFDPTIEQFTTMATRFPEGTTTAHAGFMAAAETPGHFIRALHGESGLAYFGTQGAFERAMATYLEIGERLRFEVHAMSLD